VTALEKIQARQTTWAKSRSIELERPGYVRKLSENLFQPLSKDTEERFRKAQGQELEPRSEGIPPKMHALESSSALLCNVFDYWRAKNPKEIGRALGILEDVVEVEFEAEFSTGLKGTPPTLDMALTDRTDAIWGVEAKFCEPYRPKPKRPPFSNTYFPEREGLWARRGLPNCQKLAEDLNQGKVTFERLDVPQLLKHALGLWSQPKKAHLIYLWYEEQGPEAEQIHRDLDLFTQKVDPQLDFRAITYQQVFEALRKSKGADAKYIEYLSDRYFTLRYGHKLEQ
jgi:hypothetical protein